MRLTPLVVLAFAVTAMAACNPISPDDRALDLELPPILHSGTAAARGTNAQRLPKEDARRGPTPLGQTGVLWDNSRRPAARQDRHARASNMRGRAAFT